jgi:serine/threonine-protein kinase
MHADPALSDQAVPTTLSAALLVCRLLTRQQVDSLLEAPPAPEELGRYKLGRKLGRGGMGVVYEAEDRELGRRVALKMLRVTSDADPAELADDEERFVREARLAARLPKHANIVSVYEAGMLGGRRYIAMELIEGVQFQEWRALKSTSLRLKIAVLRDVALAVHHAHLHGVIHRDLKPANILVDTLNVPHVTDFGLAKQMTREQAVSLTGSGFLLGTPAYVSPEQAQGARDVDRRTDVWSMGIMLYEILTDRLPFEGMNALDIVIKTVRDPIALPSTTRRTTLAATDKALERICMRALCKSPGERYQSAGAMADDLPAGSRDTVRPPSPPAAQDVEDRVGVRGRDAPTVVVITSAGPPPRIPRRPPNQPRRSSPRAASCSRRTALPTRSSRSAARSRKSRRTRRPSREKRKPRTSSSPRRGLR